MARHTHYGTRLLTQNQNRWTSSDVSIGLLTKNQNRRTSSDVSMGRFRRTFLQNRFCICNLYKNNLFLINK